MMATLSFIICYLGYVINVKKDERLPFCIYNCKNGGVENPPWLKQKLLFKAFTTYSMKVMFLSILILILGTEVFDKKIVNIAKWLLYFD